jgi:hypothetical protein
MPDGTGILNGTTLKLRTFVAAVTLFAAILFAAHLQAQTTQQTQPVTSAQSTPQKPKAQPKPASPFKDPDPIDFNDHAGYVSIFDGSSLKNWDGDPAVWHLENGAIVGISTEEKPVENSYIVYRGLKAKDFDLKLEIKVEKGGGSGIQYRSQTGLPWNRPTKTPPNLNWMMTGPQADYWYPVGPWAAEWSGQFYSENTPLGILAWRGQVVESGPQQGPRLMANIADRTPLGGYVRVNDWNQYTVMARGGTFIHILNGQLMAVYIDDDPTSSNNQTGFIGIEIESSPSKVSVRNVWIKKLD